MMIAFNLIFSLVILFSLITTLVAIFQIINNDFKGSKISWILISMIGLIGPILYLTKGRKLIVKRAPENNASATRTHYKELFIGLSTNLKLLFLLSLTLIIVGYLVRAFDLYMFWESKEIGYLILLISIAITLRKDINLKLSKNLKTAWSHILFWIVAFFGVMKIVIVIILLNTEAYIVATNHLKNDSSIIDELGDINDFVILDEGSIQITTNAEGESGAASINLTVKGSKKYKDIGVFLQKSPHRDWHVTGVE